MMPLLPTPFHARMAEHNSANAWTKRGAFTVPAHFGDPLQEALAARVSAVMTDISAREDLRFEGAGAGALLSAACGADFETLEKGLSRAVHWRADGGGVRGIGRLHRMGETDFLLRSEDCDPAWFVPAAPRFNAEIRDETKARGVLYLAGPFAFAVLAAARLEEAALLEPGHHRDFAWRGLNVAVSRPDQHAAYEIVCAADDATLVFDRLWRAGRMFGLRLAGQEAFELLQLEAGVPLLSLDFKSAREAFAHAPSPASLGLGGALRGGSTRADLTLAGVELDGEEPAPFATLFHKDVQAGRTLRSAYSPALKGAIALAQLDAAYAAPGTMLRLRRAGLKGAEEFTARVVALPFLA